MLLARAEKFSIDAWHNFGQSEIIMPQIFVESLLKILCDLPTKGLSMTMNPGFTEFIHSFVDMLALQVQIKHASFRIFH